VGFAYEKEGKRGLVQWCVHLMTSCVRLNLKCAVVYWPEQNPALRKQIKIEKASVLAESDKHRP
jgi:hypothetical protein